MKEWLDMRSIVAAHPELEGLHDGQQVALNHDACPAGRDNKRRLAVRRDGNTLIAWCHHCQQRGVYGGDPSTQNHTRSRLRQLQHIQATIELPRGLVYGLAEFPPLANAWLTQYGITSRERLQHGIAWSEYFGRVVLPVHMNGELVAYQLRRIMPDDSGPKYLTTRKAGVTHPVWQAGPYTSGGVHVLTEDILSAIKVSRVTNATAMMGTSEPQDNLEYILKLHPDMVVMWFDDDNPDVRAKQRKAHRRIGAFVPCHIHHSHGRDPKEHSTEEIQEVVNGFAALT